MPPCPDDSIGFWRRWLVVEFNNRQDNRDDVVRDLAKEILADERAGIFAWAVEGARRLLRQGRYTVPPSSHRRLTEWRVGANPIAQWAVDHIEEAGPDGSQSEPETPSRTARTAAYDSYVHWCDRFGYRSKSRRSFYAGLKALGYESVRDGSNGERRLKMRLSTSPLDRAVEQSSTGEVGFFSTDPEESPDNVIAFEPEQKKEDMEDAYREMRNRLCDRDRDYGVPQEATTTEVKKVTDPDDIIIEPVIDWDEFHEERDRRWAEEEAERQRLRDAIDDVASGLGDDV